MDGAKAGAREELKLHARNAVGLYGSAASSVVSKHADTLFFQGNVMAAFYCRLIVSEIEDLEGGLPSA